MLYAYSYIISSFLLIVDVSLKFHYSSGLGPTKNEYIF